MQNFLDNAIFMEKVYKINMSQIYNTYIEPISKIYKFNYSYFFINLFYKFNL